MILQKEVEELKCPYCGGKAQLRDASSIYHSFKYRGKMFVCENFPKCDSYVGCHPNTTKPLGRMANKKLRTMKSKAHEYFDPLWKKRVFARKKSLSYNRTKAYQWLAEQLDLPESKCHIGLFDVDMCRKVIDVCSNKQIEEDIYINEPLMSRGYKK